MPVLGGFNTAVEECANCKYYGHTKAGCWRHGGGAYKATTTKKCFVCGQERHLARDCPSRLPQDEGRLQHITARAKLPSAPTVTETLGQQVGPDRVKSCVIHCQPLAQEDAKIQVVKQTKPGEVLLSQGHAHTQESLIKQPRVAAGKSGGDETSKVRNKRKHPPAATEIAFAATAPPENVHSSQPKKKAHASDKTCEDQRPWQEIMASNDMKRLQIARALKRKERAEEERLNLELERLKEWIDE